MSLDMDFDLGPLTWVKAELDSALAAARAALSDWNGEAIAPLKTAAAHLHQVAGALHIVDLQGVSLLTAEVERLLADMERRADLRGPESVAAVLRAIDALAAYLDGLMTGAAHSELKLAPVFAAVVLQRGGEPPAPSELFYPDVDIRAPKRGQEAVVDDAARARAIRAARARYQRGLLALLKGGEPAGGLIAMDEAVREVERLAPGPAQQTFWWSAVGLMETLRRGGAPADFWQKRLCGRIDLQMRRLMEGSRQLAERLFRDVLYYVGQDAAAAGRAREIQDLFQLRRFFPPAEAVKAVDPAHLSLLAGMKDHLALAKDHWMRYCAGRAESLGPFQAAVQSVFEASMRLPNDALQSLARIVQAVARRLPAAADATRNEALQLEMATCLLLAQNAVEQFERLDGAFARQGETQAMRLQAAIDPAIDASRIPDVPLLNEYARAAQEKLVLAQVVQEIQSNLNQVEDILDKYFRNPKERGGLPMVPSLMKQIEGALNILQLGVAAELVGEATRRVDGFARTEAAIAAEDLDWVADALAYLGLYVEALRHGRDDSKALLRLLGKAMSGEPREATVEHQIRAEAGQIRETVQHWVEQGADADGRAAIKAELVQLASDADLVGDEALRDQAAAAMDALECQAAPDLVRQAIDHLAAAPAAAPAPSAEAVRLAGESDEVIDRELLETYIEEAHEVLAHVGAQLARLEAAPEDGDAFTAARRGYHTLKGSGRMVGLTELSEPAWEVEQTLNLWLRDERVPDGVMLDFLHVATDAFRGWVTGLEALGRARVDADPLVRRARQLRGQDAEPEAPPRPKPDTGALAGNDQAAGATVTAEPPPEAPAPDVPSADDGLVRAAGPEGDLPDLPAWAQDLPEPVAPAVDPAPDAPAQAAAAMDGRDLAAPAPGAEPWPAPEAAPEPDPIEMAALSDALTDDLTDTPSWVPEALAPAADGAPALDEAEPSTTPAVMPDPDEAAPPAVGAAEPTLDAAIAADPPAPEAGPAEAAAPPAEDIVAVGEHRLPTELYRIFCDEAGQRLADLGSALGTLGHPHHPAAWDAFIRAAHTLAGIARTTGFPPLAEAAHAVECWAGAWTDKERPLERDLATRLEAAVGHLADGVHDILARRFPSARPEVAALLASLGQGQAAPPDDPAAAAALAEPGDAAADAPAGPAHVAEPQAGAAVAEAAATVGGHATPAPEAAGGAHDDLDPQLLPIFLEEAAGLLPQLGAALRARRGNPGDERARDALKRALHTLKGSARMAGAMTLGEQVHAMESRVIEQGDAPASTALLDELEAEYDRITDAVERLKGMEDADAAPAAEGEAPAAGMALVAMAGAGLDEDVRLRQAMRQKSDILDALLNEAGEVSIARSRIENVLSSYKQTAQELSANVERLRAQLREIEIQAETQIRSRLSQVEESQFDPLEFDRYSRLQELTRSLAESVNDVSTVQDNLLLGLTEADNALVQQSRMTRTMQEELMHIRMVPINTLAERLHRVARQAARDTGRRAQLTIEGGHTELDRAVLDKIAAPLEHLVRNAVAHGLEAPEARAQAGKPEFGDIRLVASQEGNEIVLTLADDGAGVDHAAARARAVALGWLEPDAPAGAELLESLLFRSGFSTAREVTELAGRGVGLDVVKSEIAGIGGRVRLDTTPGAGTRFTIRLPLTLALSQVVLLRAGGQTYALPSGLVALVREVRAEQVAALHEAGQVSLGADIYPLRTLAELVGRAPQPVEGRYRTLLLLRYGEQRLAIRVDALEGTHEAVVKNIGPQLARIAGINGATVLGDGRVALILDPFQLAERAPRQGMEVETREASAAPLILVVDDSLTVRKITSRFLLREGFRVATARDGVEALEALEDEMPALMLLDIEMPRMDGFEVARHIRGSGYTRHLPIIMITSRTADKHRAHALEMGVDAYMGKPYQEEELLAEIRRLAHLPVAA